MEIMAGPEIRRCGRTPHQGIMSFFGIRRRERPNPLKTRVKQYKPPARKEDATPLILLDSAEID
jgi:hypothetical protein